MSHLEDPKTQPVTRVSFHRSVGYFLWLGTVGFGGSIALAGANASSVPLSATIALDFKAPLTVRRATFLCLGPVVEHRSASPRVHR